MSFRFIALGDLHILGHSFLERYMRNPSDAIYKILTDVIKYAKKNNIKHIIQLGDVFHHPSPSQHDQRRLLKFIENSGLVWHIILGNHDILEDGKHSLVMSEFHSEKMRDRLTIYTKPTLRTLGGVPFAFLPWPHDKTLIETVGITCAHVTLKGVRTDSGKILDKGHIITKRKGFWILGDVHQEQKIAGWGRYVGTPVQRTFGEALPKGFCDCTARIEDGKLKIRDRFVVNKPPFELVNLAVDCADDLLKMKPYDQDDLTLYKLKIGGGFQLPPLFRQENPHVFTVDYGRNQKKTVVLDAGQPTASMVDSDDPFADLETFLKNKGLNAAQVKRGLEKAADLQRRLT